MISKMNKYSFLIYHKEYEDFLEKLRELGVVHIEIRQAGEIDEKLEALLYKHTSYKNLLKEMTLQVVSVEKAASTSSVTIEQAIEHYQAARENLQVLTQQLPSLEKEIAHMEIWGEFDWKTIDDLKENGWYIQFFSSPERSFDEAWEQNHHATLINKKGGQRYFVTVDRKPVKIDAEAIHLPQLSLSDLKAKQKSLIAEIEKAKTELKEYAADYLPVLEQAMIQLQGDIDLLEVKLGGERQAEGALVMLEGWVPVENDAAVRSVLDASSVYYQSRPAEKEDNAPIKLKNNRITRLFETLTKMYGMPDYGEFDPTPLLAPFYAMFFGLCVGDAGYGLFLVLLGIYLKKKISPSMKGVMNLLITLGAATTVMGGLLGTFFGVELIKLDIPEVLKQSMIAGKFADTDYDKAMVFALIVGMFHICFAMLVKAIISTARYGFKNSLSVWGWLLFVAGSITVATLNYLQIISVDTSQVAYMVIGGVSAIGIYLLNNLRRNVLLNVGAGLWDTYNMATGLMGDLLSYLRLYALGLAGGMLGGVFNSLGMQLRDSMSDLLWGIPGWIAFGLIFVVGHALNIALSCLSAYVHSIRLTFVEYFKNSGYDGKGTAYKPFSSIQNKE